VDADVFDIELTLLLEAIHLRYHHDFRRYAKASIKRRLTQAMHQLGCESLSCLQEKVLREPEAFLRVLSLLTIQVSEMFRDPDLYRVLRKKVVPLLQTYPSLKIWVPGCATGEEVYSLAILLREEELLERTTVYATDIDQDALRKAEAGVYELERIARFSEAYLGAGGRGSLADYYTVGYGAAIFDKTLRKDVVFSDHSLATDGVFAEVQLVSCRNVLIYFDRELQDRAIALFRDSLCRKGFLCLGAKETLSFSSHASDFDDFARQERIYQRR
jgi:chemotaxis protein methyltransferase CheR